MTDEEVVARVAALFSRAVVPLRTRNPDHRDSYAVSIRGVDAARLMTWVRTAVGVARRSQIESALADWALGPTQWSYVGMMCAIPGCASTARSRGLCKRHFDHWYKAQRRGVALEYQPRPLTVTRFMDEHPPHEATPDCEIAWLAGLLEGEGTFAASTGRGHAYPVVSLEMASRDIVERAARILRAPSVTHVKPRDPGWSVTYRAAVSGASAASWMQRLRALMGARRRAAIDDALERYYPVRLTEMPERCVVDGCSTAPRARGLCHKHYTSWSRDVARGRAPRVRPLRSN